MKIGYVPYSADLSHPADRRRIQFWATESKKVLETKDFSNVDVLVLSSAANYAKYINESNAFIILDLVDGYLGEKTFFLKDFLRNIIRTFAGSSSLRWVTYSRHLKFACMHSHRIIVASFEQKEEVKQYCEDVHVILDNHSEFMNFSNSNLKTKIQNSLFWEGLPYTFKHFKIAAEQIDAFLFNNRGELNILSKNSFKKWGGLIGNQQLNKIKKKFFKKSNSQVIIHEWETERLVEIAKKSELAIIPVNTRDSFANLKPENKLLSMWTLGLPTLTSCTPAYERVLTSAGLDFCIVKDDEWENKISILLKNVNLKNEIISKANVYLNTHHTKKILLEKWELALEFKV